MKFFYLWTYSRAFLLWGWAFMVTVAFAPLVCAGYVFNKPAFVYELARSWARFLLWFCGIKVHCKMQKHLPAKGSFVLLFNHRSYVDILVLFASTPRCIYFGAKKELFAVPLFGWLMYLSGQIPIHREKARQVHKVFYSLKDRVKNEKGFAMAAEGGTKSQALLSPFKTGPFLLAFLYGLPVVPVVISGARECMPKGSYLCNLYALKSTVRVEFLPPQDTKHLKKTQIPELKKHVHHKMGLHLKNSVM